MSLLSDVSCKYLLFNYCFFFSVSALGVIRAENPYPAFYTLVSSNETSKLLLALSKSLLLDASDLLIGIISSKKSIEL